MGSLDILKVSLVSVWLIAAIVSTAYAQYATVEGYVYLDWNRNDVLDSGEPVVPNLTMTYDTGSEQGNATSNQDGFYQVELHNSDSWAILITHRGSEYECSKVNWEVMAGLNEMDVPCILLNPERLYLPIVVK